MDSGNNNISFKPRSPIVSIPTDVFLDVLSFHTGIDLSRIKAMHPSFKGLIEHYTNSLADTTIQHLNIVMDRDKYLDKIELVKDPDCTFTFNDITKFMKFIKEHPMRIKLLTVWNTIWIAKFLIDLNSIVEIDEVQIRQNTESRYFTHTAYGKLIFIGNIRQSKKLSIELLMQDYLHYIDTSHKKQRHIGPGFGVPFALHLIPPNNFVCTTIHVESGTVDLFAVSDIVNWIGGEIYISDDGFGRCLIFDNARFDVTLTDMVQQILKKINLNPRGIGPFTILFKNQWTAGLNSNSSNNSFEPLQICNGTRRFMAKQMHDNNSNENGDDANADGPMMPTGGGAVEEFSNVKKFKYDAAEEEGILPPKLANQKAAVASFWPTTGLPGPTLLSTHHPCFDAV